MGITAQVLMFCVVVLEQPPFIPFLNNPSHNHDRMLALLVADALETRFSALQAGAACARLEGIGILLLAGCLATQNLRIPLILRGWPGLQLPWGWPGQFGDLYCELIEINVNCISMTGMRMTNLFWIRPESSIPQDP